MKEELKNRREGSKEILEAQEESKWGGMEGKLIEEVKKNVRKSWRKWKGNGKRKEEV